jgi:hypothetical protein
MNKTLIEACPPDQFESYEKWFDAIADILLESELFINDTPHSINALTIHYNSHEHHDTNVRGVSSQGVNGIWYVHDGKNKNEPSIIDLTFKKPDDPTAYGGIHIREISRMGKHLTGTESIHEEISQRLNLNQINQITGQSAYSSKLRIQLSQNSLTSKKYKLPRPNVFLIDKKNLESTLYPYRYTKNFPAIYNTTSDLDKRLIILYSFLFGYEDDCREAFYRETHPNNSKNIKLVDYVINDFRNKHKNISRDEIKYYLNDIASSF